MFVISLAPQQIEPSSLGWITFYALLVTPYAHFIVMTGYNGLWILYVLSNMVISMSMSVFMQN